MSLENIKHPKLISFADETASVTRIDATNEVVYGLLSQGYEADFSPLTHKRPDAQGQYAYTRCDNSHLGYLLWRHTMPIGFVVVQIGLPRLDIAEFYIIPSERRAGWGRILAHWAFRQHTGAWQVRQLLGADWAYSFWLRTIGEFTKGDFSDAIEDDPEWGRVHIQKFFS